MAAGNVARVLRGPGRVVVGPTDLGDDFPYGGTQIGLTKMCVLKPIGTNFRVVAEGLGGEPTDVLHSQNEYVCGFFLRGWDDDAVRFFWPDNYSAGAVSGHTLYTVPGSMTAGGSMLSHAMKVLYVPDDPVHVPAMLIYSGIPDWSDSAEMALQRREELGLPVQLDCIRDPVGRILQIGMLADLTL
jgi:hypothetical protein